MGWDIGPNFEVFGGDEGKMDSVRLQFLKLPSA
jgi:hypothetical protein